MQNFHFRIGLIPSHIPNTQYVSVQKVLIRFGYIGHFQLEFVHVTCLALTGFHYLLLIVLQKAIKGRQGKINQGLFEPGNMFLHVLNWLLHGKYIILCSNACSGVKSMVDTCKYSKLLLLTLAFCLSIVFRPIYVRFSSLFHTVVLLSYSLEKILFSELLYLKHSRLTETDNNCHQNSLKSLHFYSESQLYSKFCALT